MNNSSQHLCPVNCPVSVQHKIKMVLFRLSLIALLFVLEPHLFSEKFLVDKFFSRDYRECSEGMTLFKSLSKSEQQGLVPFCLTGLQSSDDWTRIRASLLFYMISPQESKFVPVIAKSIQDPCEEVRAYSILFLGNLGVLAHAAIPALTVALETDTNSYVRRNARKALKKIKN